MKWQSDIISYERCLNSKGYINTFHRKVEELKNTSKKVSGYMLTHVKFNLQIDGKNQSTD